MHKARHCENSQAQILSTWASNKFGLTAMHDINAETLENQPYNPVDIFLSDVTDLELDNILLKQEVEIHDCSGYCLEDA